MKLANFTPAYAAQLRLQQDVIRQEQVMPIMCGTVPAAGGACVSKGRTRRTPIIGDLEPLRGSHGRGWPARHLHADVLHPRPQTGIAQSQSWYRNPPPPSFPRRRESIPGMVRHHDPGSSPSRRPCVSCGESGGTIRRGGARRRGSGGRFRRGSQRSVNSPQPPCRTARRALRPGLCGPRPRSARR